MKLLLKKEPTEDFVFRTEQGERDRKKTSTVIPMNSRMQNNKCFNWNELNTIDSVAIRSIMLMKLEYIFDILCIEWKYWCMFYCAINNDKKK